MNKEEFKNVKVELINPAIGVGEVINVEKDKENNLRYINVHFLNRPDGEVNTYSFPEIFLVGGGKLSTKNKRLRKFIKECGNDNICDRCKEYSKDIKKYGSKKLCVTCVSEMVKCDCCNELFEKNECIVVKGNKNICKECLEKFYDKCSICDEYYEKEDLISTSYANEGKPICELCADDEYYWCNECNMPVSEEFVKRDDQNYEYCPDCAEKVLHECRICGKQTRGTLCYECFCKQDYDEYIKQFDLKNKEYEVYNFYTYQNKPSIKLMSRLQDKRYCELSSSKYMDVLFIELFGYYFIIQRNTFMRIYYFVRGKMKASLFKQKGSARLINLSDGDVYDRKIVSDKDRNYEICFLEKIFKLRAQTVSDTCYDYEHEYGETTDFYIIGYIKT